MTALDHHGRARSADVWALVRARKYDVTWWVCSVAGAAGLAVDAVSSWNAETRRQVRWPVLALKTAGAGLAVLALVGVGHEPGAGLGLLALLGVLSPWAMRWLVGAARR
jgi:hypothetical protein